MATVPTGLRIEIRANYGTPLTIVHLFVDRASALEAYDRLSKAARDYHDRANDRQRFIELEALAGPATVDVTEIAAISVEDSFGDNEALIHAWNEKVAEQAGTMKAIAESKKAIQPEGAA